MQSDKGEVKGGAAPKCFMQFYNVNVLLYAVRISIFVEVSFNKLL